MLGPPPLVTLTSCLVIILCLFSSLPETCRSSQWRHPARPAALLSSPVARPGPLTARDFSRQRGRDVLQHHRHLHHHHHLHYTTSSLSSPPPRPRTVPGEYKYWCEENMRTGLKNGVKQAGSPVPPVVWLLALFCLLQRALASPAQRWLAAPCCLLPVSWLTDHIYFLENIKQISRSPGWLIRQM